MSTLWSVPARLRLSVTIGYQTLIKEFITERLYEAEKRQGIIGARQSKKT
jgi:hypothetical protein